MTSGCSHIRHIATPAASVTDNGDDDMTTYEVKIHKRGKGGWKAHQPQTEDASRVEAFISGLVVEHEGEEGSYQMSVKVNGGYSEKKEHTATMVWNLRGPVSVLFEGFNRTLTHH